MKRFRTVLLAGLIYSMSLRASGTHTAETFGIPILEIQDPFGYKVIVYLWVILIGLFGGITAYVRKMKTSQARFSLSEILGECVISTFVALVTFMLCESAKIEGALQAAIIGICSHMGSRAIYQFEDKIVTKFLNKILGDTNGKSE